MTHIDISGFRVSKKWNRSVKNHMRRMHHYYRMCDEKGLKDYINTNSKQIKIVKNLLKKWSFDKCWYSEGRSETFHLRVDHFRPKNEISLIKNSFAFDEARTFDVSIGYWWLSFDWKNFRLTGEIVNSYKGSFFPLCRNSFISRQPNQNHNNEINVLLDPTVKSDADLITFNIDGLPTPAVLQRDDSWAYERADISIRLYGLRDNILIKGRKIILSECNKLIDRAEGYWLDWNGDLENSILQRHFADVCADIIAMTKSDQPFSSMVKSRLKVIPYSSSWVHEYIMPHI